MSNFQPTLGLYSRNGNVAAVAVISHVSTLMVVTHLNYSNLKGCHYPHFMDGREGKIEIKRLIYLFNLIPSKPKTRL